MKNFLSALVTISCSLPLLAQVTISGRLLDANSGEPMPFVSVSALKMDSTITGGTLTEDDGSFVLTATRGPALIHFTYLGYATQSRELFIGENNDTYKLGKIDLVADAQTLEQVTVTGDRATVSGALDKKYFDFSDRQAQGGGSILDVMKALPGITVTLDGNVQLRGSDRVAVLVDGKQSALTGYGNQSGLGSIPAANIERVEIITNPSAKYDATGAAGIINIVYKKEDSIGLNGEVGLSYALGEITTRRQDLPTELGRYRLNSHLLPNLSLNYATPKVRTWFQGEVLAQRKLPNNEFTTRFYDDGRITISQVPENRRQIHYIAKGGLDYALDEHNQLSVSAIYDFEHHIDTAQIPFIDVATNQRYRYWHWKEDESTGFINVRTDLRHNFGSPGHDLEFAAQYTRGREDEQYFLNDSSAVRIGQDTSHLIAVEHTTAFNVDYIQPLPGGRVEAGGQVRYRRLPVSYQIGQGENSIIYPGLGRESRWTEDIYAAYVNYVYETARFEAEAGFRTEQTAVTYTLDPDNIYYEENDAYDYFRLYPNVRLTLKLNEASKLSAFFNQRVDRPGEPELRAFAKYDDPELLKIGNPFLRPQFTESVELAYRRIWSTGSLYTSIYGRTNTDAFQRIFDVDASNPDYQIVNRIYQNTGRATNRGVELLWSQEVKNWWKFSVGGNFYRVGIANRPSLSTKSDAQQSCIVAFRACYVTVSEPPNREPHRQPP